jgi:hypothetical protein
MSTSVPLIAVGLGAVYLMLQSGRPKRFPEHIEKQIADRVAIEEIEEMIKKKSDPEMLKFMDTPASIAPAIESVYTPEVATKMLVFGGSGSDMGYEIPQDMGFGKKQKERIEPAGKKQEAKIESVTARIDDSLKPVDELADGTESAFPVGYSGAPMMNWDYSKVSMEAGRGAVAGMAKGFFI